MSLESFAAAKKTVGAKQTLKAMKRNEVVELYVANDCDDKVAAPILDCAEAAGLPVDRTYSMAELGQACRIKVGAAAVGLLASSR